MKLSSGELEALQTAVEGGGVVYYDETSWEVIGSLCAKKYIQPTDSLELSYGTTGFIITTEGRKVLNETK